MPKRQPRGDLKIGSWTCIVEFRGEGWAEDINLGETSVIKITHLDGVTQGVCVVEEKRSED